MGFLNFLQLGNKVSAIEEYVKRGAIIIDVRSYSEFANGNVIGSKNIPLPSISHEIENIKKCNKPVIVCCKTGIRSAQAVSILKDNGIDCVNGGGWNSLNKKLSTIN